MGSKLNIALLLVYFFETPCRIVLPHFENEEDEALLTSYWVSISTPFPKSQRSQFHICIRVRSNVIGKIVCPSRNRCNVADKFYDVATMIEIFFIGYNVRSNHPICLQTCYAQKPSFRFSFFSILFFLVSSFSLDLYSLVSFLSFLVLAIF